MALLLAVDDGGERSSQIGEGINRIELAGFDERGDYRPILCSRIVSGEESILPVQRYRTDGPLTGVVIDLYAAVGQEDTEAVPVFGDIGECFAKRRLASDTSTMLREPGSYVGDQWR